MDVAVIGGGAAALWLANRVQRRGLSVAVCTVRCVGGWQTLASQGIVHGGVKYAVGGANGASAQLAAMPARWRSCLAGCGEIDLRAVPILAERIHLYCAELSARPRALAAAQRFGARCRRVDAADVAPLRRGLLFETQDFALDVPALIRCLAAPLQRRFLPGMVLPQALVAAPTGLARLDVPGASISAGVYVFAAGVGNLRLAERAGFGDVALRRLPLRQTCIRPARPMRLFAHCLAGAFGMQPELTITTHGGVLYVGGRIASDGAERAHGEHVARLRRMLARALPDADFGGARFDSALVDRAEPAGERRIGAVFAERRGNCVLALPQKLSLLPALGDAVLRLIDGGAAPCGEPWPGNAGGGVAFGAPPYADTAEPAQAAEPC